MLGFKKLPTKNGASANLVIGQPNFTSNNGGTSSKLLGYPVGVASDGKKLFVVDFDNSRLVIWNKLPTKTRAAANVVVGQPDFTSSNGATTRSGWITQRSGWLWRKAGYLFRTGTTTAS